MLQLVKEHEDKLKALVKESFSLDNETLQFFSRAIFFLDHWLGRARCLRHDT